MSGALSLAARYQQRPQWAGNGSGAQGRVRDCRVTSQETTGHVDIAPLPEAKTSPNNASITATCLSCHTEQPISSPITDRCGCGLRAWTWDDGQNRPHRNYDRMTVAWGGTTA